MTHVTLSHLTKVYGDLTAVGDLSLEVESGELVALLGPSGCGKTTTLRMIAGLIEPSSGDVLFDDKSMLSVPTEKRGAVMVFQKHLLFPTMSVAENVGFGLRMLKVARPEIDRRVGEMLDLVNLPGIGDRKAHELSGGQQQRIALARALIVRPKLLLLDEPLANLDANLRIEMRELIRSIQAELGITAIFVTHDQEEAVMLADSVALMFSGQLHQYGKPTDFYDQPRSTQIARFFRNPNTLAGVRVGSTVSTDAGKMAVDPLRVGKGDGRVVLTVRPEDIQLVEPGTNGVNCIDATVVTNVYVGTHRKLIVALAGTEWHLEAPTSASLAEGDPVCLRFAPERVWLLPDDAAGSNGASS